MYNRMAQYRDGSSYAQTGGNTKVRVTKKSEPVVESVRLLNPKRFSLG